MVCVGGRYQLLGELGRGGISTVFLAVDTVLHKQWAVKETLLQGSQAHCQRIVQSLHTEVEVLKACDHPAIPRIVDFFEENGRLYVVRDYVKGYSLQSLVESQGLQNAPTVRDWGMQLCEILAYLHAHHPPIVYGDLKPSNVMIVDNGTVRLIDFGAATQLRDADSELDAHRPARTDVRFVTPRFTAPEVIDGSTEITPSSDVYAIGMTLRYALLPSDTTSGSLQSTSDNHQYREMTEQLIAVLAIATAKDPAQRYPSCEAMFAALEDCCNVTAQRSRSEVSIDERKQQSRRSKRHNKHHNRARNNKRRLAFLISATIFVLVAAILLCTCLSGLFANASTRNRTATFAKSPNDTYLTSNYVQADNSEVGRIKGEYDMFVKLTSQENNPSIAESYAKHAMKLQNRMLLKRYISHLSTQPLQALLQVQLADKRWSSKEEQSMMCAIAEYEQTLRLYAKSWAQLAQSVGRAYWHYYAGFSGKVEESEHIARGIIADQWFQEATQHRAAASNQANAAYTILANNYGRLVQTTYDSHNIAYYQQYVRNLRELLRVARKQKDNNLRLRSGEVVVQSVYAYISMFLHAGISGDEVEKLCEDARDLLEDSRDGSEIAKQRAQQAIDMLSRVHDDIATVFAANQQQHANNTDSNATNIHGGTFALDEATAAMNYRHVKQAQDVRVEELQPRALASPAKVIVMKNGVANELSQQDFSTRRVQENGVKKRIYTIFQRNFADNAHYQVRIISVDKAGNYYCNESGVQYRNGIVHADPATVKFTVDSNKPIVKALNIRNNAVYQSSYEGKIARLSIHDDTALRTISLSVDGKIVRTWRGNETKQREFSFRLKPDGVSHNLLIKAVDYAGNAASVRYDNVIVLQINGGKYAR